MFMIYIFINNKSVIFIQKVFNGVFPFAQLLTESGSNCASLSQHFKIMTNLSKFSTPSLHHCKLVNNLATLKIHSILICEPKIPKICHTTRFTFRNLFGQFLIHQVKGNLHSSNVTWRWQNKDNSFYNKPCKVLSLDAINPKMKIS